MSAQASTTRTGRGFVRDGARPLSDDMLADGWRSEGHEDTDWFTWTDYRTRHLVMVEGPFAREGRQYASVPCLHGEPDDPATDGYIVSCAKVAPEGHPEHGAAVWVASLGEALRIGRDIRRAILAEHPHPIFEPNPNQLTLAGIGGQRDDEG